MEPIEDAQARAAFLLAFGARVRKLRHRTGLSQIDFAAHSGVHRVTVGLIERGKREIGVSQVPRLVAGLGVEPGDLFAGL